MKRKCVYIAGPITKGSLLHNINQATAVFVELAKAGLAPFCPHWSVYSKPATQWGASLMVDGKDYVYCHATVSGNDEMNHSDWLGIDLAWVAKSEALLRLPGESTGADMEVAEARKHGIPVFHSVAEVVEWAGMMEQAT